MVANGTVSLGPYTYTGNWIVADCRDDVLLGMPWHAAENPRVDYRSRRLRVQNHWLEVSPVSCLSVLQVTNLEVKKFRRILRRGKQGEEVFCVVQVSSSQFSASSPTGRAKASLSDERDPELRALLTEFEDVFQEELPHVLPLQRDVDHEIETLTNNSAPHCPLYQLSPAELVATRDYVDTLLHSGKIRPSKSPYAYPLFFVKEPGRALRGAVDYRGLNRITKGDNASLSRCDEIFDCLGKARFFSKLDLKTGFHQIRLHPSDIEKTAFNSTYGQFEYLVMPMGLYNDPATVQSLINRIFNDCIDRFLVVHIDDILIYSNTREEHLAHVCMVLTRLKEHQLYDYTKKCSFMNEEAEFLSFVVGRNGI